MSDKAKQILCIAVGAIVGMAVCVAVKTFLINITSDNPGIILLMSAIAGGLGALTWVYTGKFLSKMLKVEELDQ